MDRDAAWRHPRDVSWDARIQVPFSPETAASGIGDTSFLRACWYRTPLVLPRDRGGRPDPPALRRGGLRRHGLDRRPMPRRTRGRLYAVHVRHHRMLRPVAGRARRTRRRRPAGSREAARQAGLAGRAPFHLVSADDRHLAVRLDGGGAAYRHSESSVDGEHRALGSGTGMLAVGPGTRRASTARAPDELAITSLPMTRIRSSTAKSTAASRCRTQGSTTTGTSCSGVPNRRR